jgi:hypothetical protein
VEAESAREKLAARMEEATVDTADAEPKADRPRPGRRREPTPAAMPSGSGRFLGDFLPCMKQAIQRDVLRGRIRHAHKRL